MRDRLLQKTSHLDLLKQEKSEFYKFKIIELEYVRTEFQTQGSDGYFAVTQHGPESFKQWLVPPSIRSIKRAREWVHSQCLKEAPL